MTRSERSSTRSRGRAQLSRWTALIGMLVVTLVTASLGQWQLRRAQEKIGLQAKADLAARSEPLDASPLPTVPDALEGRAVRVRGQFVPAGTIYIDNRTHRGVAGFHVLTPVRIMESSMHVLVLRGWVPRDVRDRNRLPDVKTPSGNIEIVGMAQGALARSLELKAAPAPRPGERLWQNLDPDVYRTWSGLTLQPYLVRQAPGAGIDDGLIREWRAAGTDVDKHRAYALQWFVMSAAALAVTLYLIYLVRRDFSQPHHPDA